MGVPPRATRTALSLLFDRRGSASRNTTSSGGMSPATPSCARSRDGIASRLKRQSETPGTGRRRRVRRSSCRAIPQGGARAGGTTARADRRRRRSTCPGRDRPIQLQVTVSIGVAEASDVDTPRRAPRGRRRGGLCRRRTTAATQSQSYRPNPTTAGMRASTVGIRVGIASGRPRTHRHRGVAETPTRRGLVSKPVATR